MVRSTKKGSQKETVPADKDECEQRLIHLGPVKKTRRLVLSKSKAAAMANLLTALGDESRLRILSALSVQELCVCDVAAVVGLSESAVSHQLRVLRQLNLAECRKDGRIAFYKLCVNEFTQTYQLIAAALDSLHT